MCSISIKPYSFHPSQFQNNKPSFRVKVTVWASNLVTQFKYEEKQQQKKKNKPNCKYIVDPHSGIPPLPFFNCLQDPAVEYLNNNSKFKVFHGGALGMALVTFKTTLATNPVILTLASNPTFMSGLLACLMAQSIKVVINFFVERKWDFKLFCACGGMPSSHSALASALTTSVALSHGVGDSLFPVSLGFSLIVMYDAIGVRRHAGIQAEVLNKIIEDLFQGHPMSETKLKELLGHTPSQVVAGALLGMLVAWFCCQGCFPM